MDCHKTFTLLGLGLLHTSGMLEKSDHSHAEKGVLHKPWEHTALKMLSWGGLGIAGLALAPVIFSAFSTNAEMAQARAIAICGSGDPVGAAGGLYTMLGAGSVLTGSWATAALAGGIAIGGLWLGNYIDKHTEQGKFRWGAVVRWAALGTSMLIALPAILTGISMGLNFFGLWSGTDWLNSAASAIGTIGKAGAAGTTTSLSAAGLAGVHALTCALPGVAGFFLGQKEPKPMPQLQVPVSAVGRVMPLPGLRQAVA